MNTHPQLSSEQLPAHCLYLLASQAPSGFLANLFKVGIADCFPVRYAELTRIWGAFDLSRSALLWAHSRQEVRRLETIVRYTFGDPPGVPAMTLAAGPTPSPDTPSVPVSWRRHPGRVADGHTEFYAAACLPDVLSFLERLLSRRGGQGTGARLQRGITPADCVWQGCEGTSLEAGSRDRAPGWLPRLRARHRQTAEALNALADVKISGVLALALEYEAHLLCVDLYGWHWLRKMGLPGGYSHHGLVNLFFGGFGTLPNGPGTDPDGAAPARLAFEAHAQPLLSPIEYQDAQGRCHRYHGRVCTLQEPCVRYLDLPEHLHGVGELLLRVEAEPARPGHPSFEEFVALAARVEARRGRAQSDFGW